MKEKEIPKSCAQCRHFHQHYVRVAGYRYAPLDEGHCSEPTRRTPISYAVFCLKKKKDYHPPSCSPSKDAASFAVICVFVLSSYDQRLTLANQLYS